MKIKTTDQIDPTNPLLALIPCFIFFVCFFFQDSNNYKLTVSETCFGCGNYLFFIQFTCIFLSLIGGLKMGNFIMTRKTKLFYKFTNESNRFYGHAKWLIVTSIIVLSLMYIYTYTAGINLITTLETNEFSLLREESWAALRFVNYAYFLPAYAFFVGWDYYYSNDNHSDKEKKVIFRLSLILTIMLIFFSIFTFNRSQILNISFLFILARFRVHKLKINLKILFKVLLFALFAIYIFGLTTQLRVSSSQEEEGILPILEYFVKGYFLSPFNRLCLILNNNLELTKAPPLFYSFGSIYSFPPPIRDIIYFIFDVSDSYSREQIWRAQFDKILSYGLNGAFIWPTAFGSVFNDLGWFVVVYYFILTIIVSIVYTNYKKYAYFCRYFYPHVFISLYSVFGDEAFFSPRFIPYLILALFSKIILSNHYTINIKK